MYVSATDSQERRSDAPCACRRPRCIHHRFREAGKSPRRAPRPNGHDHTGILPPVAPGHVGIGGDHRPSRGNGVGEDAGRHLHIAVIWNHHNIGARNQVLKFALGEIAVHEPDSPASPRSKQSRCSSFRIRPPGRGYDHITAYLRCARGLAHCSRLRRSEPLNRSSIANADRTPTALRFRSTNSGVCRRSRAGSRRSIGTSARLLTGTETLPHGSRAHRRRTTLGGETAAATPGSRRASHCVRRPGRGSPSRCRPSAGRRARSP